MEGGATLANAMRGYPKIFDDLTTNMIKVAKPAVFSTSSFNVLLPTLKRP